MERDRRTQDSGNAVQLELFASGPFTVRLQVSELADLWWEHEAKHIIKWRKQRKGLERVKKFLAGRYSEEVSKFDVERMRREFAIPGLYSEQGLKANSINSPHAMLTRLFNWAYECREVGVVHGIDWRKVQLPQRNPGSLVPKINEKQFAKQTPWQKKHIYQWRDACIQLGDLDLAEAIEMLYKLDLRPCDFFRITDRNVSLARGVVFGIQNKSITRKNPSGITFLNAITDNMAEVLKRRIDSTPPGQPLFSSRNLQKRIQKSRKRANLPTITLGTLRHSAATLLLDNGVDPETVKNVLGHTTLRMLPTYAVRTITHLKNAVKTIEDENTEILTPNRM